MSSNYSFETVKEQLIDYYNEHGRMPTQSEIMSNPNLPSWTTMIKFLGPKSGWAQLLPPSAEDHLESSSSDEEPSIEEHHESAPHDECVVPVLDDEVEIRQAEGAITIEVKLSLPHRDKPVTFTITV